MKHTRQRTDIIHGTIYLSELETELSSTPFFYRLHDIYQSSTVYLTFPSNRTKRYEHSLGTMALASEMLFSSITNASPDVRHAFFEQLNNEFCQLYRKIFKKDYPNSYLGDNRSIVVDFVAQSRYGDDVQHMGQTALEQKLDQHIYQVFQKNLISDRALNHFSLHSTKSDFSAPVKGQSSTYQIPEARERLIYQCILQAVRVVALFHDIGHPPYSHIIENVLKELYQEYRAKETDFFNSIDSDKSIEFNETLGRFLDSQCGDDKKGDPLEFDFLSFKGHSPSSQLHEQVGIHMFRMAIEAVIPGILHSIKAKDWTNQEKTVVTLYYLTVTEFAAAILLEKNPFFLSIHRIVDGTIDADRLDYVARDSHNSGVDWGSIPYKRLIDSAKLICLDSDGNVIERCKPKYSYLYAIAYPQKISSDIEDFLLNRHKIFSRINYHHRCTKTAAALQSAVRILAKDYLTCPSTVPQQILDTGLRCIEAEILADVDSEDLKKLDTSKPFCISDNICILWTAIGTTNGDEALKVLQWNDSWMVSTLQSALLRLRTEACFSAGVLLQTVRKIWMERFSEFAPEAAISIEEKKDVLRNAVIQKQFELNELQKNLEEFLLNKKVYYSLFKRGIDVQHFVEEILKSAGLSLLAIQEQLEKERIIYLEARKEDPTLPSLWDCLDSTGNVAKNNAKDAIERLEKFLFAARIGDLSNITIIFPEEHLCTEEIIRDTLELARKRKEIIDFKLYKNPGWGKTGLPDKDTDPTKRIYLYVGNVGREYDTSLTLRPQINAIQHDMLWLYIYVIPSDTCQNTDRLLSGLRVSCASAIGKRIRQRFDELFPSHT